MGISFVNFASGLSTAAASTLGTAAQNVTDGDLLVVVSVVDTNITYATTPITDTAGNTFNQAVNLNGANGTVTIWYAINCKGNASNVTTVHYNGSPASYKEIGVLQYSGANGGFDTSASNSNSISSTTQTAGTFTPAASGELCVAAFQTASGNTSVFTSGYTQRDDTNFQTGSDGLEDRVSILAGNQTVSVTWSTSTTGVAALAVFKPTAVTAVVNMLPEKFMLQAFTDRSYLSSPLSITPPPLFGYVGPDGYYVIY